MSIMYKKIVADKSKFPITSGIICAKGNSIVSTLSTNIFFNSPIFLDSTMPKGRRINFWANFLRISDKISYAVICDSIVDAPKQHTCEI